MSQAIASFVRQRNKYRSLRQQLLLTTCVCLFFALNMGVVYAALGGARGTYGGTALLLMLLFGLLPFCLWLALTSSFYGIARLIGAQAQFSIFLRSVGYGMGALIPASALWAVGRYLGLPAERGCSYSAFTCDPATVIGLSKQVQAIFAFYAATASSMVFKLLYAVSLLCILAGAYYWTVAIDESSTLTRQGAAIAVGIPVGCFVLALTLFTF